MKKIILLLLLIVGCTSNQVVPHEGEWGIYSLDLETQKTELVYSTTNEIVSLNLNPSNDLFVFSMNEEICTLNINGTNLNCLTDNDYLDTYPSWSPDGSKIIYLSFNKTMDIRVMDLDGGNDRLLYDSGNDDSDVAWHENGIVFTQNHQIWIMNEDGTNARPVTNPPRAGEWGRANLPFGDYDPRYNGTHILFERLMNDESVHGNYNLFMIKADGTDEIQLTNNGYSQGFAEWIPSGKDISYLVAAKQDMGKYRIYFLNLNESIIPDYFPSNFLCHKPTFKTDTKLYFPGQWYT